LKSLKGYNSFHFFQKNNCFHNLICINRVIQEYSHLKLAFCIEEKKEIGNSLKMKIQDYFRKKIKHYSLVIIKINAWQHNLEGYQFYIFAMKKNDTCMIRKTLLTLIILVLVLCSGCNDNNEEVVETAKITLHFVHKIDGSQLQTDTLKYINAAGNHYLITEIQYFISDVTFYKKDGTSVFFNNLEDVHYVDTDIPETQTWDLTENLTGGIYDSIAFTFGISEEKNISGAFTNPPESYMFWPDFLGGGYHYMKLNGNWLEAGQTIQTTPFNLHLGIGQIYYSFPDSITGFIQNDFRVSLQGSSFEIAGGDNKVITLTMNIENWFKEPNIYDLDIIGGSTMQNQEAMQKLKENGHNVFSVLIE
jgi:hypothetical protein